MNDEQRVELPVVLSIAGSDSGGGAGIQADLKAITALGCFGTTAITCVTAQNPSGVRGVEALSATLVGQQIEAVCEAFPVAVIKTGMLFSAEIVRAVAKALDGMPGVAVVVDPVMVATSGSRLLREDAIAALEQELLPRATVITPNVPEAEALLGGVGIASVVDQERGALALSAKYGCACALKGGHLGCTEELVDVLAQGGEVRCFAGPRIDARETHGTGCTFASACAAWLARGASLTEAVEGAKRYVAEALVNSRPTGQHWPLGVGGEIG